MKSLEAVMAAVQQVNIVDIQCSPKNAHAIALFDLANEHSRSIFVLAKAEMFSSAFALARSCIEAFIRGAWLQLCASDEQAEDVWNRDGKWPDLVAMLKQIDAAHALDKNYLTERYIQNIGILSSLTHGLKAQSYRRLVNKRMAFCVSDDEITGLLSEACFISIVATMGICEIANRVDAIIALKGTFERFQTIAPRSQDGGDSNGGPHHQ